MRTDLLATVALLLCLQPVGAIARPDAVSPYRLQLADPATYRLKSSLKSAVLPTPTFALPYAPEVRSAAKAAGLDVALLHAVIAVESGHNATAVSPKGARGLMQLMPATARRYGVRDLFEPAQNLRGGSAYLRDLLIMFDGNFDLALAAYNAGEGAVLRHGRQIPPYAETQHYVPRVLGIYQRLRLKSQAAQAVQAAEAAASSPYRLRSQAVPQAYRTLPQ